MTAADGRGSPVASVVGPVIAWGSGPAPAPAAAGQLSPFQAEMRRRGKTLDRGGPSPVRQPRSAAPQEPPIRGLRAAGQGQPGLGHNPAARPVAGAPNGGDAPGERMPEAAPGGKPRGILKAPSARYLHPKLGGGGNDRAEGADSMELAMAEARRLPPPPPQLARAARQLDLQNASLFEFAAALRIAARQAVPPPIPPALLQARRPRALCALSVRSLSAPPRGDAPNL